MYGPTIKVGAPDWRYRHGENTSPQSVPESSLASVAFDCPTCGQRMSAHFYENRVIFTHSHFDTYERRFAEPWLTQFVTDSSLGTLRRWLLLLHSTPPSAPSSTPPKPASSSKAPVRRATGRCGPC